MAKKCSVCGEEMGDSTSNICWECRKKLGLKPEPDGRHHFDPTYDTRYIRKYPDKTH